MSTSSSIRDCAAALAAGGVFSGDEADSTTSGAEAADRPAATLAIRLGEAVAPRAVDTATMRGAAGRCAAAAMPTKCGPLATARACCALTAAVTMIRFPRTSAGAMAEEFGVESVAGS